MAGATGLAGAWLERLAKYNEESFARIARARVDIEKGNYNSERFFNDLADWSEDTVDLWMPLAGSGTVAAAVVTMKHGQRTADMLVPLQVVAPETGDPQSTALGGNNGHVIAARHVKARWSEGKRGVLALGLVDLEDAPPLVGYYTGAVFVGNELIASVHVRVDARSA
jgi:hypothetical protein